MGINLRKTKEIIFKNIIHSGFYDLCQLILIIIFVPLIINKLGIIEFGLIAYLKIFSGPAGFYTLFDFGLRSFMHIEIAKLSNEKNKEKILTLLFSNIIFLTIFASIIVIIVLIYFFEPIINYLNIPPNNLQDFSKCLKVAIIFTIIELPFLLILGLFEGFQKIKNLKKYDLIFNFVFIILSCLTLVAFQNINFTYIFYMFVIINFIKYLFIIFKLKKFKINFLLIFNINLKILKDDLKYLLKNFKFLRNIYFAGLATNYTNYLEKIFIIVFINDIKIYAIFEVISKFPKIIKVGSAFLSLPVLSNISIFFSKQKISLVKLIYLKILKLNFIITYSLIIAIILFAEQFLIFWINEEMAKNYFLLQVLAGYCFLSPINSIGSTTLFGCKYKTDFVLYNSLITNFLRLAIWISTYKYIGIWSLIISYYTNLIPTITNTYFVKQLIKLNTFQILLNLIKFLTIDIILVFLVLSILLKFNLDVTFNIFLAISYIIISVFFKIYSDKNIYKDFNILIKKII